MKEIIDDSKQRQQAVIAAVDTGEYDIESSVAELTRLCESAGAPAVAEVIQKREKPDPRTYLGAGKIEEIKLTANETGANLLVVDAELTAARLRNIERSTDLAVVDRTTLILDIFARRAVTAEGKLQVELAQLKRRLLQLTGSGSELSRLGGGIGTRGPGETKLETDRRRIRARITSLEKQIAKLALRRELTRERRKKGNVPVISLVGYTNVGKSSLFNALTGSNAVAEDMLFATLDATARKLSVGDLQQTVLIDTVGFVSRLPHELVEAFSSTLEEMTASDLIIKVMDASSDDWERQIEITDGIIERMNCSGIEHITVFNKCDIANAGGLPGIPVSAKTGAGLETLKSEISKKLSEKNIRCSLLLPFDKLSLTALIRQKGSVLSEEYTEEGLLLKVIADKTLYRAVEEYVT